jgi:3-oxoacid CoA-transferase subunit A
MNKVYPSVEAAVEDIPDGATVGFGGFFAAGKPTALTLALAKRGARNLTVVVMQMGIGNEELLELVKNRQVKKAICNYPLPRSVSKGANHPFEQAVRRKEVELEVYPMGTWVEKLRCAGAGLPAFYTPTGVGTVVAEGKEVRVFNGKEALLETALPLDFGFVHAFKGDPEGNLVYRYTAANYNNAISMAAEVTIAQVENMVEVDKLDPNNIHTPGIFVQRVVQVERPKFIPGID